MEPLYCVFNETNQTFLGLQVGRADNTLRRLKGLLGKFTLAPGEGLWVLPSRGIHTVGMLFPIDVIYLDKDDRIVHLQEHMTPFRMGRLRFDSASVLELPPHTIFSTGTRIGDQLLICLPEDLESHLRADKESAAVPDAVEGISGGLCTSNEHTTERHPAVRY